MTPDELKIKMAIHDDEQAIYTEQRLAWSKWREDSANYYRSNVSVYGNNFDLLKLEEKIHIENMIEQITEKQKGE
jgi:hypothetical protein